MGGALTRVPAMKALVLFALLGAAVLVTASQERKHADLEAGSCAPLATRGPFRGSTQKRGQLSCMLFVTSACNYARKANKRFLTSQVKIVCLATATGAGLLWQQGSTRRPLLTAYLRAGSRDVLLLMLDRHGSPRQAAAPAA